MKITRTAGAWLAAQQRAFSDLLLAMDAKQLESFAKSHNVSFQHLLRAMNEERTRRRIEDEAIKYLP